MSDETRYTEKQWAVVTAVYAMHGYKPPQLPLSDEQARWVIIFANSPRDPRSPSLIKIWGEPRKLDKVEGPWPTLKDMIRTAEAMWVAGQPLPRWHKNVWNRLTTKEMSQYRYEVYDHIVNLPQRVSSS